MYSKKEIDEAVALVRARIGAAGLFGKPEDYVPEAIRLLREREKLGSKDLVNVEIMVPAILPMHLLFDIKDVVEMQDSGLTTPWVCPTREGLSILGFPERCIDSLCRDIGDLVEDGWPIEVHWSAQDCPLENRPSNSRYIPS